MIFYYLSLIAFLISLAKGKHRLFSLAVFSFSLIVLFYKADLKQPLLIFLPHSTIAINTHRQAICIGSENLQTNKVLSYYGALLVSKKYDSDKQFLFKLCSQPDVSIILKEEMQNNSFLLTLPVENDTLPNLSKRYVVSFAHYREYQSTSNSSVPLTSSLSLTKLSQELSNIDVKICCPQNLVSIRVSNTTNKNKI